MKSKLLVYIILAGMNLVSLYFAISYISADYLFDTSGGGMMRQSTQGSGFWIFATALANLGLLFVAFLSERKSSTD